MASNFWTIRASAFVQNLKDMNKVYDDKIYEKSTIIKKIFYALLIALVVISFGYVLIWVPLFGPLK